MNVRNDYYRVASNYTSPVTTNLHVIIVGGISVDQVFPIDIGPGAVKKFDFFTDAPLIFPSSGAPYVPFVSIAVEDPNAAPPGDCRPGGWRNHAGLLPQHP